MNVDSRSLPSPAPDDVPPVTADPDAAAPSPAGAPRFWRRAEFWLPLALLALTALIYANSFRAPFLFDDYDSIVNSEGIKSFFPLNKYLQTNRPMVEIVNRLNFLFANWDPRGYHTINYIIHLVSALALYGLIRRSLDLPILAQRVMFRARPWLAFAIAAAWAAHPLNTQAVTYIIQRSESMMGMFVLIAMYAAVRYIQLDDVRRNPSPRDAGEASSQPATDAFGLPIRQPFPQRLARFTTRFTTRRSWWLAIAMLGAMLGMMTKQVAVVAPLLVLCFDWTLAARSLRGILRRWPLHLGMFATWLILLWLLRMGQALLVPEGSAGFRLSQLTWIDYFRTQPEVILHYLKLTFLPLNQCFDYRWPVQREWADALPYFIPIVLLGLISLAGLIRRRWWGLAGTWFFLTLAPSSSFVPILDLAVEHRMYLALIGVLAAVIGLGYSLFARRLIEQPPSGLRRAPALVLIAIIVLPLALLTVRRNHDYRTDVALWSTVVEHDIGQHNARAYNNLAMSYTRRGDQIRTLRYFHVAIRIDRNFALAHTNLGNTYMQMGQYEQAIPHLTRAIEIWGPTSKRSSWPQKALARCYDETGKPDLAIEQYRAALRTNHDLPMAHNGLGALLAARQFLSEAIIHFRAAVEQDEDNTMALVNLGKAQLQEGRRVDAEETFRRVLRHPPDTGEILRALATKAGIHGNYIGALAMAGTQTLPAQAYIRALPFTDSRVLTPAADYIEASWRLSELLSQPRTDEAPQDLATRLREAVPLARKAVSLAPFNVEARKTLARVLNQQGDFIEAYQHYEMAALLRPADPAVHAEAGQIAFRLGLHAGVIEHYAALLQNQPDQLDAIRQLAWTLATTSADSLRDPARAEQLADHAIALTDSRDPLSFDALAAALAAQGQFNEALATIDTAIQLARDAGRQQAVTDLQARRDRYAQGQPLRIDPAGGSPARNSP